MDYQGLVKRPMGRRTPLTEELLGYDVDVGRHAARAVTRSSRPRVP